MPIKFVKWHIWLIIAQYKLSLGEKGWYVLVFVGTLFCVLLLMWSILLEIKFEVQEKKQNWMVKTFLNGSNIGWNTAVWVFFELMRNVMILNIWIQLVIRIVCLETNSTETETPTFLKAGVPFKHLWKVIFFPFVYKLQHYKTGKEFSFACVMKQLKWPINLLRARFY